MAQGRGPDKRLTPLETLIMNVLWDESPAAVRQVQQRLESVKPMAYNTVLTMMRILREKGFLVSEREGRSDLYRPVVTREAHGAAVTGRRHGLLLLGFGRGAGQPAARRSVPHR